MNPVMISFGSLTITWYAFFIVLSLLIGLIIVVKNKKVKNMIQNEDVLYNYFFNLVLFSIIGARTWYVLFSLDNYISNPLQIFAVWNGGLAIHGAIFAGLGYTYYFTKKNSYKFLVLTDAIAPALLLGQALGRWGNFVNQEAHGPKTTESFLRNTLHLPDFIVNGMYINGIYYQPTFLYESIWNILGFLIIIIFIKHFNKKDGFITAYYLMWYGFIRMLIEILRTDALTFMGIKVAQISSLLMLLSGIILFIIVVKKRGIGNEYR